jgi:hypothetical protein
VGLVRVCADARNGRFDVRLGGNPLLHERRFSLENDLLLFAGVNALMFHFTTYRGVKRWERGSTPFEAKFAGVFSILLWFGIVAAGRWIAFT